jgi:NTP pyrophosphatase (non-canonical NTP hydrolase)
MDSEIKIEEIKKWVRDFCEARDWDEPHTAKDLAIGLVTEASELLEIFRFVPQSQQNETLQAKREAIADELADSLFFILRFAGRFGFDLSDSLARKLEKNVKRYPPKNP